MYIIAVVMEMLTLTMMVMMEELLKKRILVQTAILIKNPKVSALKEKFILYYGTFKKTNSYTQSLQ